MSQVPKGSVLITRPENDAHMVADEIEALGYHVMCQPFLKVEYLDFKMPDLKQYAGLIVTSANAIRALGSCEISKDIAVYTVGDRTAELAQEAGFINVQSAAGTVDDLASMINAKPSDQPFLYLRGKHISKDIETMAPDVCVEEIIIYHTDIIKVISPWVQQALMRGEVNNIVFFSKRTAEGFIDYIKNHPQGLSIAAALKHSRALCLGDSMVECLSNIQWKDIQVAKRPERQSLLDLLR